MFNYCLMIVTLVLAVDAFETAKPGCPDECGGVKIHYPFGFGPANCNFNDEVFRIKCDNTTHPPAPFILDIDGSYQKLVSINLDDHTLRLYAKAAFDCYTINTGSPYDDASLSTTTSNKNYSLPNMWPFNISGTRNKLRAIGCDTEARVFNNISGDLSNSIGCVAGVCNSLWDVSSRDGTCSPPGCCQTSIFTQMLIPTISVDSLENHSEVMNFNPCSYAFVGEVGSYEFSKANLSVTAQDLDMLRVPVVYEWAISGLNCSAAKGAGNGALLCGTHAHCVDDQLLNVDGYTCQCMQGYAGNPYLSNGCQDINECGDERLNTCQGQKYCVNKMGGFECSCPHGFYGNGTSRHPCIPDPGSAKLVLGLSMCMGSIVAFVILYGLFKIFTIRKDVKKRKQYYKRNGGLLLQQELSTSKGTIDRTKIFTRSDLEKATDNYNNNRVLGHGGQGTVYKGMLANGTIVAVKKSKKVDEHQLSQFINEVAILSQINHRNVVKLFGCCLETEVPMLVYEFVPNGTLYHHIHHPDGDFCMTWKIRFQIAVECAEAIAYLHSSCSSPIYHRDIKSSNILLDEKYKAKVSDFGTSRTISVDKTHVTTFVQGTFGYLDPEFFSSGQFSEKSDVYSFGVVLLELITSKKPIFTDTYGEAKSLAKEFIQLMECNPNQLDGILDIQVSQNCNSDEIEVLAKLIERCLHINGRQRPTMRELATTLNMIKSRLDEHDNNLIDHRVSTQQGNQITLGNDGLASSAPLFTKHSFSIDVEPLLFDSI